ncbi:MAG: carboxypeptidase-like regulatory domain-containing protein, partial [Ginsengibacter sp.]
MKYIIGLVGMLLPLLSINAQIKNTATIISGKVISASGNLPLRGVSVTLAQQKSTTYTDDSGAFTFSLTSANEILTVSHIGFYSQRIPVSINMSLPLLITLQDSTVKLDEVVVNTGYQYIPKERATGSFVHIDNELLNRRVSTNILDRLEGVTSGLIFNPGSTQNGSRPSNEKLGITIRGRSSIDEKVNADPLIVLDNFPYEGDINNINPNDIESITVLKDAAAASIWGARAGNGVIVITTKKGRMNQPLQIEFSSSFTTGKKPDLFYSSNFLQSSDYIDAEKFLFDKGYFNSDISNTTSRPPLSPAVEIFAKVRAGSLSQTEANSLLDELKKNDVRNDFSKYVYRKSAKQQYSISLHGGSSLTSYFLSVGYDKNAENLIRNSFERFTLNSLNNFTPFKNLVITAGI